MTAKAHTKAIYLDPKLSNKGSKLVVKAQELAKIANTILVVVSEAKLEEQQEEVIEVTVARRVNRLTTIWTQRARLRDGAHQATLLEMALLAQHLQLTQADIRLPGHRETTALEQRQRATQPNLADRTVLQPVHAIIKEVKEREALEFRSIRLVR